MNRIEQLSKLGYPWLPSAREHAIHPFVNAIQVGELLFTSGQVSMTPDGEIVTGKVGSDLALEDAVKAAELCAVQALYAAGSVISLEALAGVVKQTVFVNCAPGFTDTPRVATGSSNLLMNVLRGGGWGVRTAIGAAELPLNAAVEIEVIFRLL